MRRRILIVDDHDSIREMLKDRLEAMGYDVMTVSDGRSALALIAREAGQSPIEGVLLDLHMPAMDGLAVLRELHSQHPELRTIMMSANHEERIIEKAIALGAKAYLIKPIDNNALRQTLLQIFSREDHDEDS